MEKKYQMAMQHLMAATDTVFTLNVRIEELEQKVKELEQQVQVVDCENN